MTSGFDQRKVERLQRSPSIVRLGVLAAALAGVLTSNSALGSGASDGLRLRHLEKNTIER
jgi:hypothetical protein